VTRQHCTRGLSVVLALTISACAMYENVDPNHPLQARSFGSSSVVPTLSVAYPEIPKKELKRAVLYLRLARGQLNDLTSYSGWLNFLAFQKIQISLEHFPADPWAWSLMANFLILERQPAAASVASDYALTAIFDLEHRLDSNSVPLPRNLVALEYVTKVNKALLTSLQGKFGDALSQIRDVEKHLPGDPILKMKAAMVELSALIETNNLEEASTTLLQLREQLGTIKFESKLFDDEEYPQFFDKRRRSAIFDLFEGELHLRQGSATEAEIVLRRSIVRDPELLTARLALANALYAQQQNDEAASILVELIERRGAARLYEYDVAVFNLGNIFLASGQAADAIREFKLLTRTLERRDAKFSEKIESNLPKDVAQQVRRAADQPTVAQAYNNLGSAMLDLAVRERNPRPLELEALTYFKRAPSGGIRETNVAKAQDLLGDHTGAIQTLESYLQEHPRDAHARSVLLTIALRSASTDDRSLGLDALLRTRGSAFVSSNEDAVLEKLGRSANELVGPSGANELEASTGKALSLMDFLALPAANRELLPLVKSPSETELLLSKRPSLDLGGKTVVIDPDAPRASYTIVARTIRFSRDTLIVTNGNELSIIASDLISDGGRIASFVHQPYSSERANPGRNGKDGGVVHLHVVDHIEGRLIVQLRGQDGGDGVDGANGVRGGFGAPGRPAVNGTFSCAASGMPGGQGEPGGPGQDGQAGGNGGNGGRLEGEKYSPSGEIQFEAEPGRGGHGGNGGAGGPGGLGGPGGDGSTFCGSGVPGPPGLAGLAGSPAPKGKDGLPGSNQVRTLERSH
jgi:tetratricopeptide (TPR) repeat protein